MELTLFKLTSTTRRCIQHIPLAVQLTIWYERYRQRRALLRLDDRMLKDIGVSRCEAEQESGKPFWVE
ncbi:DUF1127 domain-containing protein [Sedimenticola selenatireducens]|jgi:uncharacterized protein YjiS (DUF1127 family)|uniref:DUF1127 domain-containing protein n=1 Tax=Sedimenticola selenatireducens TaxID=191960 RepID=A0A557RZD7_9GAMM|nr:DUF1127 domain-containing protein [Sedimenticola selenatireducens]TVO70498.1 DUF1127 domain-containing protein [Sedimenticola selenatireducens]TVT63075.1 MAG: DUF1127 domain-containing protein [Sedimenticola selenatireducens]